MKLIKEKIITFPRLEFMNTNTQALRKQPTPPRYFLAMNQMDLYRLRPKRQKSKQKLKLDKLNQDSLDPFESEDDVQYDVQKILTKQMKIEND